MASIFTRKAVGEILADENLTAEERTERVFSLYGRALDDGYLSKSAAQAAQNAAVEAAKTEAVKGVQAPDVTTFKEYQELVTERDMLRAINGDDFKTVKPKFRESVFKMIDRAEGAKPLEEQLSGIREKYEEYFTPEDTQQQGAAPAAVNKPMFGAQTQGSAPTGKTGPSFMDTWGFVPKQTK